MDKRLTRDPSRAVLGGVAAGLGDYLDVDPVIIRLVFIILCLAGGSGLILYVVCWLIIPRADDPVRSDSGSAPPADRRAEEMRVAGSAGGATSSGRRASRGGGAWWPAASSSPWVSSSWWSSSIPSGGSTCATCGRCCSSGWES